MWSILDCTLRDGGYYTDWDFEPSLVRRYLDVFNNAPVKYVELGYRNFPKASYFGEYYYLPRQSLQAVRNSVHTDLSLSVMLDAKACSPENVSSLLQDCIGLIQLVRIAVNPNDTKQGIALATRVKECGFEVAVNLMYLSKLSNNYDILLEFANLGNTIDFLYLVDSYGSCFPEQVSSSISFAKKNLPQKVGFHGHDNLGLAFANTVAAISSNVDIVDSTILGMGRGAGNLRTELILAYLLKVSEQSIDLAAIAELVDAFQVLKDHYRWGSSLPYMISGLADLPQKHVMELLGKRRYSTSVIVETLQKPDITPSSLVESHKSDTPMEIPNLSGISNCIIIGGGISAKRHSEAIIEFAHQHDTIILHSSLRNLCNYLNLCSSPQLVCLPGREISKIELTLTSLEMEKVSAWIVALLSPKQALPIPEQMKLRKVSPIYSPEHQSTILEQDTPLGLALGVTRVIAGIKTIYLAGFDGYPTGNHIQKKLAEEVQAIIDFFLYSYPESAIFSLTPTLYSIPTSSIYSLL